MNIHSCFHIAPVLFGGPPSPPSSSLFLSPSLCKIDINSVASPTQQSRTEKVNDYLVVQCLIPSSVPAPTVTWNSGGSPVTLSSRVGVTLSGALVYSNLISGDATTLTCTVSNSVVGLSQITSQTMLTVQCKFDVMVSISFDTPPPPHPHCSTPPSSSLFLSSPPFSSPLLSPPPLFSHSTHQQHLQCAVCFYTSKPNGVGRSYSHV